MDELTPEQIKKMIGLLQSMLTDEQPEVTMKKEEAEPNAITTPNKKPRVSNINKFDEMMESSLHKDDIEIDKKLAKYGPTPRLRKFQPINVVCRICGKKESISPSLVYDSLDRYKCNKCSQGAG